MRNQLSSQAGLRLTTPGVACTLAALVLASCNSHAASQPLWPGSKYTEADRSNAMLHALAYIERSAAAHFHSQASDYLYCFYSIAATARNPELKAEAARIAPVYAKKWADSYSKVPVDGTPDDIADLVFGWLPASLLGQDDTRIKPELRRAVARFNSVDFLQFDATTEPPPSDIPAPCRRDSATHPRGAKLCRKCGRPLEMRNRYERLDGSADCDLHGRSVRRFRWEPRTTTSCNGCRRCDRI